MLILGIDPGVARVGYGVLQYAGERIVAHTHGCIETTAEHAPAERLHMVGVAVRALCEKYHPDVVAVEKLFFEKNVKTAIMVAEGRGSILFAAAEAGIPIVEMTPLQVKMAVTGSGRADKQQVQEMVRRTLKLVTVPKPDDAADALAIAMTGMRFFAAQKLYAQTQRK